MVNETLPTTSSGGDLARITYVENENKCDACEEWGDKIVSLSGDSDTYPSIEEARDAGWDHPNCVDTLDPVDEGEMELAGIEE